MVPVRTIQQILKRKRGQQIGMGPVGDGAHARHEHLLIGKTLERAALLSMLLIADELE